MTDFILLQDEKMKCSVYADELAKLELKWKDQVKISESMKLQLAAVEDQYKVNYWLLFVIMMNGILCSSS